MARDSTREEDIFHEAVRLTDPAARNQFLLQACGNDEELRRGVEALMAQHEKLGDFLDKPLSMFSDIHESEREQRALAATGLQVPTEDIGMTIAGKYKLKQKLGSGGMGIVFVAQQRMPIDRQVAIKIIKPGYESREILARFAQEQQALALLDHPNIAKIIDAGQTELGRPFFVMELVKGVPLTKFCDEHKLSIEERIQLFIPVCAAVQHAHQKSLIHRDLKPSNILVALYDGRPVPKVIDFGVAKAMQQRLTPDSIYTEIGKIIGTLEYMSPEQAELNQLDIDTRTDIYSLGVILYELLTGFRPIDAKELESAAFLEKLRIIREVEPQKPSTKLSSANSLPSVAAQRKIEPRRLCNYVHGDLDWIVMQALAKERSQRYETANAFAVDLQRFLASEPVLAGPPSASYRLRKSFQKYRGAFIACFAVFFALVLGVIGTAYGWSQSLKSEKRANLAAEDAKTQERRANEEAANAQSARALADKEAENARSAEKLAKEEANVARSTVAFLTDDLLSQAIPDSQIEVYKTFLQNLSIRQALDRAAGLAQKRFEKQPRVLIHLKATLGKAYASLGDYASAETHLKDGERHIAAQGGNNEQMLAEIFFELGKLALLNSKFADAETSFTRSQVIRKRLIGANDLATLRTNIQLAVAFEAMGKIPQAKELLLATYDQLVSQFGKSHPDALLCNRQIAGILDAEKKFAEAEMRFLDVLNQQKTSLGLLHSETQITWNNLAAHYVLAENAAKAEQTYVEIVELNRKLFEADHPMRLMSLGNLAASYYSAQKFEKAKAAFEELLPQMIRKLTKKHELTIATMQNLAACQLELKQFDAAEALFVEAFGLCRELFGDRSDFTKQTAENLESLYEKTNAKEKREKIQKFLRDNRNAKP